MTASTQPVAGSGVGAQEHNLTRTDLDFIVSGTHPDPYSVLGAHRHDDHMHVTLFEPGAENARLLTVAGEEIAKLDRIDDAGLFAARIEARDPFSHLIEFETAGNSWQRREPASFGLWLGETDA